MAHADDDGMIVPPRIAPTHVVILPIAPKPDTRDAVFEAADKLADELRAQRFHGEPIEVEVDKRDLGGGVKNWEWIKKGVPVRIEIGPRDIAQGTAAVSRRDQGVKEKQFLPLQQIVGEIGATLQAIQDNLYARAPRRSATANTRELRHEGRLLQILHARRIPRSPKSTAASRSRTGAARASARSRSRTT